MNHQTSILACHTQSITYQFFQHVRPNLYMAMASAFKQRLPSISARRHAGVSYAHPSVTASREQLKIGNRPLLYNIQEYSSTFRFLV